MTDTLDAIAREMREWDYAADDEPGPYEVNRWADRITALSNQGEGDYAEALTVAMNRAGVDCTRGQVQCALTLAGAEADRRDAERFRFLESKARQSTNYDVFGNGGHWAIGIHSKDNRLTFAEAIDAATQEQT